MEEGQRAGHALMREKLFPIGNEVFAGAIISLLSIAYGLSYAALIFSGPLTPSLGYGIAATFLTAAISAAVVALRSSLPFAIAGPDSSASAVTATLVAALIEQIVAKGHSQQLVMPALIVMALSAALTGLLLCALGITRAGRAIRFVPYPVIGGFLGATGWFMSTGAVRVITGSAATFDNIALLIRPHALAQLAAGIAVAFAFHLGLRRPRNSLVMPGILLASVAATHVGFLLTGETITQAAAEGWVFQPQSNVGLTLPWHVEALRDFPWRTLPALSGDLLAVMFVTAVSLLLNITGIEFAVRREANLERELNALGLANLLSAAFGGYASCTSVSRSTLNYAAGARSRLSGLTCAAISAALLLVGQGFLVFVPKFVLGGLLLYFGVGLLIRWLIESASRLSIIEYLSLLAIALIIVEWGFIAGVLIGVVIGCATFALSASRVNAIKFSFDGSEFRSSLDRSADDLAVLAKHGGELQGMNLQSYLFFGSAARLFQDVKALLARHPDCRFLVFDFRLVTGLDSSATHSFTQIKQAANDAGAQLVLVELSPELEKIFRASRFIADDIILAPDLDRALESCENAIVAAHRGEESGGRTLTEWLAAALGNLGFAEQLAAHCTRLDVAAGDGIARQGDAADGMHFILEGRVGINVEMPDGRAIRVRSLGPHTTIGEMGLITRQPRSASIAAEVDSVLYSLSVEAYQRIVAENPPLAQALLTYIVGVMSERLSFASRLISVLRR
jgi:SulP family sulfate permease